MTNGTSRSRWGAATAWLYAIARWFGTKPGIFILGVLATLVALYVVPQVTTETANTVAVHWLPVVSVLIWLVVLTTLVYERRVDKVTPAGEVSLVLIAVAFTAFTVWTYTGRPAIRLDAVADTVVDNVKEAGKNVASVMSGEAELPKVDPPADPPVEQPPAVTDAKPALPAVISDEVLFAVGQEDAAGALAAAIWVQQAQKRNIRPSDYKELIKRREAREQALGKPAEGWRAKQRQLLRDGNLQLADDGTVTALGDDVKIKNAANRVLEILAVPFRL